MEEYFVSEKDVLDSDEGVEDFEKKVSLGESLEIVSRTEEVGEVKSLTELLEVLVTKVRVVLLVSLEDLGVDVSLGDWKKDSLDIEILEDPPGVRDVEEEYTTWRAPSFLGSSGVATVLAMALGTSFSVFLFSLGSIVT